MNGRYCDVAVSVVSDEDRFGRLLPPFGLKGEALTLEIVSELEFSSNVANPGTSPHRKRTKCNVGILFCRQGGVRIAKRRARYSVNLFYLCCIDYNYSIELTTPCQFVAKRPTIL